MKKFLFLLSALFSFNAFAANLEEGKQYVQVGQTASAQPEVIEFFSFYCPHCYAFEMEYHIPKQVAESLPKGTEFKQYHVNFLGRQSENLTRAWALAMALGAESKVKAPLFEAAQQDKLSSMDDIRKIFIITNSYGARSCFAASYSSSSPSDVRRRISVCIIRMWRTA